MIGKMIIYTMGFRVFTKFSAKPTLHIFTLEA